MQDMPRSLPPYLQREMLRGKLAWYVRVKRGPRIRIREPFNTPAFWSAYETAISGKQPSPGSRAAHGTLAWLIEQYRDTAAWRTLSTATRRQRENIFRHVIEAAGCEPFKAITRNVIVKGRDRRAKTPSAARHFIDAMRGVFRWALDADLVKADPTAGVTAPKPKTKGFPVWTEEEIEKFERRWPRGTRERIMFDIFVYTGLRRGDAARLGRQHVRNGVITIDTEKTGTRVELPMLPDLEETLKAGPVGDLAFIATASGRPMAKEAVGNAFRAACRAAGINKSAHGLRKAAATRAANRGATVAQLEAIFGWEGGRMAALYTRSADRRINATAAMDKLAKPEPGTSSPAHQGLSGPKAKKAN